MINIQKMEKIKLILVKGENFKFSIHDYHKIQIINDKMEINLNIPYIFEDDEILKWIEKIGIEKLKALKNGKILNEFNYDLNIINELKIEYNGKIYLIKNKNMMIIKK